MPGVKKTKKGWIVTLDDIDFRVGGQKATGLFIHGHQRDSVWLNYAGFDGDPVNFELPSDREALKAFASAIQKFADDPEYQ